MMISWKHKVFAFASVTILVWCCCIAVSADEPPPIDWISGPRGATVALGTIRKAKVINPDGTPSLNPDGTPAEKEIFAIVGTGVITGFTNDPLKTPYLVTAKHVLFDPDKKWDPAVIQLRFSWFDSKPVDQYLGISVPLKEASRRLWTAHPDPNVDLAAIPIHIPKRVIGRESIESIPLANFAVEEDLYESAPVLVLGYPGAVGPSYWSRALARSGIIAWVHPTKPTQEPLLVDAMVFPGNSGGPAFKLPTGMSRQGALSVGGAIKFLGIITQGRNEFFPLVADGKSIEISGPSGPMKIVSQNSIGIGVVESAARVQEVLEAARASMASLEKKTTIPEQQK